MMTWHAERVFMIVIRGNVPSPSPPKLKEWLWGEARVLYRRMKFDVEKTAGGKPTKWVRRGYKAGVPRRQVPCCCPI